MQPNLFNCLAISPGLNGQILKRFAPEVSKKLPLHLTIYEQTDIFTKRTKGSYISKLVAIPLDRDETINK